ncbi:uncharacterized protein [Watersipora subatra]|uniref:uncharacterized protein n=1 Tax=Watersipora subatra TaxID=2589382 RepID=UPI00355BDFF2
MRIAFVLHTIFIFRGFLFGDAPLKSTSIFGVVPDREVTGALAVSSAPSLFDTTSRPATSTFSMFGSKAITSASTGPGLFGVTTSIATTSTGLFEFNTAGLFRSSAPTDTPTSTPTLFTSTNNPRISFSGLFGAKTSEGLPPTSSSSLLESGFLTLKPPTTSPDLLGAEPLSTTPSVFGIKAISDTSTTSTSNMSTAKTSTDTPTSVVFGSKVTSTPFSTTFAQPSKTIGTTDSADGSLLRSLLSEDAFSSKASTGFNMQRFSFTAPPKVVTGNDNKSEDTEKTSKPSVFAGFTGFTTSRSSSAAAFTFSTPSSTASTSKASPFVFTPPTTNLSQGLLSPKSGHFGTKGILGNTRFRKKESGNSFKRVESLGSLQMSPRVWNLSDVASPL